MDGPVAEVPKLWSLLESPRKQIQEIAGPSPRAPNLACVVLCTYENFSWGADVATVTPVKALAWQVRILRIVFW